MIDSKLINEDVEQEIEYPCLMINRKKDLVVWFECSNKGTAVYANNKSYDMGEHSDRWDMKYFTKFNGEVILSNK